MFALLAVGSKTPRSWLVQLLTQEGEPAAGPRSVGLAELAGLEHDGPRWVFDSAAAGYSEIFGAGLRFSRCHDVTLTERILLGREGLHGAPASAPAVFARRRGMPVPRDCHDSLDQAAHPTLFSSEEETPRHDPLLVLGEALRDQLSRIGPAGPLRLLVAAESASALAAVEMGAYGLPLRAEVHQQTLTDLLGPRPLAGARPSAMAALAGKIDDAFGFPVNPDSASELREAFRRSGFDLETTRSWVIREIDHPAVPPLLEYKELSRLFTANGWNWLSEWVRGGRFHAEYLPGGVVSGRWAARGGGGLQIPKIARKAVIADPGKTFVVADAAQLEPRVLAAMSNDAALQDVSTDDDLYTALADDGFGGDRARAKLAMLGAMYGQTSGEAGRLLAVLRQRYPVAMGLVEDAARRGEQGEAVFSILGRRSPVPGPEWRDTVQAGNMPEATAAQARRGGEVARSWGRFTRNFIVQGSASDWASVWLSGLRRELAAVGGAELVFFQHDELIVHTPLESADRVAGLARQTAYEAARLVFPGSRAATPVRPVIVECYADAK